MCYYNKAGVNMNKKIRVKRQFVAMFNLILFSLSIWFVAVSIQEVVNYQQLSKQYASAQINLSKEKKNNDILASQRVKLSDPEYLKEYARGNFMLSGSDEQIFVLPSNR